MCVGDNVYKKEDSRLMRYVMVGSRGLIGLVRNVTLVPVSLLMSSLLIENQQR